MSYSTCEIKHLRVKKLLHIKQKTIANNLNLYQIKAQMFKVGHFIRFEYCCI